MVAAAMPVAMLANKNTHFGTKIYQADYCLFSMGWRIIVKIVIFRPTEKQGVKRNKSKALLRFAGASQRVVNLYFLLLLDRK
ncbi:hypothetical protein [Rhizobium sp.]|jgi:hypothetical protein|uniref:hypothetical protein n=1 Tax=Rhizobium sp. TaxID=391 RepID=UPI000E7F2D23|nr:hypothetical protein [Rhizobium sp.]